MSYPYLIQGSNLVVVIGNVSHTISKTHVTYQKVVDAIKAQDWETVKDVVEPRKVVLKFGAGNVTIDGETLFWRGKELNTGLAVRMIAMLQEGFDVAPMAAFMENLMSNPSNRAVNELYGFLEKCNLPITPDGHFLAYKKVRNNYLDCHSGTMDNSVGQIVEMERNQVNDNKDQTCSAGLHFCSMSYLGHFGGDKVMILKINPRDVVSIPSDYNDAKGRACRYEVIGELNVDPEAAFTKSVQDTAVGSAPVAKKKVEPKQGSTAFYRGYSDGYGATSEWDNVNPFSEDWESEQNYDEGFEKGFYAVSEGLAPRYVYVAPAQAVKKGNSPFYQGYHSGYNGIKMLTPGNSAAEQKWMDGFMEAKTDLRMGRAARFEYDLNAGVAVSKGAWPFGPKNMP